MSREKTLSRIAVHDGTLQRTGTDNDYSAAGKFRTASSVSSWRIVITPAFATRPSGLRPYDVGQAEASLARVSAETSPNRLKLFDWVGVSPGGR
jgi:hypothetical protein